MSPEQLKALLEGVRAGQCTPADALEQLRRLPFEDLGYAQVDHHRYLRQGFPEVIFGQGKTSQQIISITQRLREHDVPVLITRLSSSHVETLRAALPKATFHQEARCAVVGDPLPPRGGTVAVVCAGTSDIPVAEEAAITATVMGNTVERIYDVGVAGLHRLLARQDVLQSARVLVVVAGMEGALPSVVGGLVRAPVIAVPTSVGYGAAFGGLAALLGMLNSCASGVSVVNIDNGFGAGYIASLINHIAE
ncbi:MAG: nickel pincer cofactor biosynthesis protein LarB [Chloroflexi bacterium]|nr:nickel pincer cofactor biosynthesis protein LarB [Chloroflexota bacterium]